MNIWYNTTKEMELAYRDGNAMREVNQPDFTVRTCNICHLITGVYCIFQLLKRCV